MQGKKIKDGYFCFFISIKEYLKKVWIGLDILTSTSKEAWNILQIPYKFVQGIIYFPQGV